MNSEDKLSWFKWLSDDTRTVPSPTYSVSVENRESITFNTKYTRRKGKDIQVDLGLEPQFLP